MFHYTVSSKYMQEHFGTHTFKINALLLSGAYPIIAQLYGPTQELELEFKFARPMIGFGIPDNDIGFQADFDFGIKLAGDMNFLVYDELHLKFKGDVVFDQEVFFGELSEVKLEQSGENKGQRTLPIYNNLAMTKDHYDRFWQWAKAWADGAKNYMNHDVLPYGLQLPYWSIEVLTQTMFK